MKRQGLYAHIALGLVSLFYSINYFVAKDVFKEIPPLAMVAIRCTVSCLFFYLIIQFVIREWPRSLKDYGLLVLCGIFGATLNQVFFYLGLDRTLEVNASVLMTSTPVFVFLLALAMGRERMNPQRWLGLIIALMGALMLSLGGQSFSINDSTLIGDVLVVINAIAYAVYLVIVKPLMERYHTLTVVFWVFFFGSLINIPLGMMDLLSVDWGTIQMDSWLGAGYIILFATIGTYGLNAFALKRLPSSSVGIYIYLQPVMVAFLAFFLRRNDIDFEKLFYILLVISGVILVSYKKSRN